MGLTKEKAFINGDWVDASNEKTFEVRNPANGELVATVPNMGAVDTEKAVIAASEAFKTWQNTSGEERSKLLRKWSELLKANAEELAKILSAETGKPSTVAAFETHGLTSTIEFFAEEAKRLHGEIIASPMPGKKLLVEKQPLGVVGLISPWNFPLLLSVQKMAVAMAAGCTFVIKPAEDSPLVTLAAVQLAHDAGFPKGVLNVVTCARENAPAVGKVLCENPIVRGISFTGSTVVGKILYQQCAPHIKRITLELGGNSPFLVFKSANVDKAVQLGTMAKFMNSGQICVAPNRFIVQEEVYDEFVSKFAEAMKNIKAGEGVGPLINIAQFKKVSGIVDDARSKGAKIHVGGKAASEVGELFYEPTLITDATKDMQIYTDEVFGPVASVIKFKTEEEAIAMANDTEKGLASYFFSEDVGQIFRVSRLLESGVVWANDALYLPTIAPFGGIKQSGIGKEGSSHGIDEFCILKYICIGNL